MIFKLQRPLITPDGDPPMAMAYDRQRKVTALIPWHMVEELFEPGELKIYVKGRINRRNQLLVDEIVAAQNF